MRYIALMVLAIVLAACGGAPSPMQKWQAGNGGRDLAALEKVLTNGTGSFAGQAGQIFHEAAQCMNHPPPTGSALYLQAMSKVLTMGMFTASGDLTLGDRALNDARATLAHAPAGDTWAPGLSKALGS